METLGQVLRRFREQKGFNLSDFSNLTKMAPKVIESLESDDLEKLSGDFYVRGYIKTYARYLSMDYEKLIGLYEKQTKVKKEKPRPIPAKSETPKIVITPKILKLVGIVTLAFVLVFYLIFQVQQIFEPPTLAVTMPEQDMVISETFIEIRGQTEEEARVFINDREIFADATGFFHTTLDLNPGINLIKISAKKTHSRENVIFREILVQ